MEYNAFKLWYSALLIIQHRFIHRPSNHLNHTVMWPPYWKEHVYVDSLIYDNVIRGSIDIQIQHCNEPVFVQNIFYGKNIHLVMVDQHIYTIFGHFFLKKFSF